ARIWWDISWIWGPPEDHLGTLVHTVGVERFVFGTGQPLRIPENAVAKLDLLDLGAQRRAAIESENARAGLLRCPLGSASPPPSSGGSFPPSPSRSGDARSLTMHCRPIPAGWRRIRWPVWRCGPIRAAGCISRPSSGARCSPRGGRPCP